MRTDGEEITRICEDSIDVDNCINVVGDWVFYINADDRKMYKIRTDGSERQRVVY